MDTNRPTQPAQLPVQGKAMKTYRQGTYGGSVTVDGRHLPPRLDLVNHSPTGLASGYGGSAPAQLALALLCDHLGDDREALALYQSFKWQVVANMPASGWTLTSDDIDRALAEIRAERAAASNR